jgi:predicted nucleic acid-binding protein
MYLDSAYIAKYYVNEPDAPAVRKLIRRASHICSSAWALVEVACVFRRHMREKSLTIAEGHELIDLFRSHVEADFWNLIPITDSLLGRTAALIRALAPAARLRAGDVIHLATALDAGEAEVWTNDRQLLSAAQYAGLAGRSVTE